MSQTIVVNNDVFARLQKLAEPFVDTPETVILRLLDAYRGGKPFMDIGVAKVFDPQVPPNLVHTTVISAVVNGHTLKPQDTYWNNILIALIKRLAEEGRTAKEIQSSVTSNTVLGEETANGYKFVKEAGISIQGLDANNAWKTISYLAAVSGQTVEVKFRWQNKENVELAGVVGLMVIGKYED